MAEDTGQGRRSACFRHEWKYMIDLPGYLELRERLRCVLQRDPHAGPEGRYLIRSVYFDNYRDKALQEKITGVSKREKFRIRYYNDDLSFILLEKKVKEGDLCGKTDAQITKEECLQLLEGRFWQLREHSSPLVREFTAKMHYQVLRPKVLVSYIREAYVYPAGNVRVTFDGDIRTSPPPKDLKRVGVADISALDMPRDMVLEVKFDAFLPEVVKDLLQTGALRRQAFSKYALCRRYG